MEDVLRPNSVSDSSLNQFHKIEPEQSKNIELSNLSIALKLNQSGESGSTFSAERVNQGLTDVASRAVNELPIAQIIAQNVGATAQVTTQNLIAGVEAVHTGQEQAAIVVRAPQAEAFDENDIGRYLVGNKAQLVFSTAAKQEEGVSRSVDLTKKVEDVEDPEPDEERQTQVNVQFAKLKYAIGVAGRDPMPNKAISYSVTWHFVEVYDQAGEPPKKYDLLDKADIERLLNDQAVDNVDRAKIDDVYSTARDINREIKSLTEREVGKTKDCFLHDYIGNPNGLELFRPFTQADLNVKGHKKQGIHNTALIKFKLAKHEGKFFAPTLTASGADAFNQMEKVALLQQLMKQKLTTKYNDKKDELDLLKTLDDTPENQRDIKNVTKELSEIQKARKEVGEANKMVMQFTLMELNSECIREPLWNGDAFVPADPASLQARDTRKGVELLKPVEDDDGLRVLGPTRQNDPEARAQATKDRRFRLASKVARDYDDLVSKKNPSSRLSRKDGFLHSKPYETTTKDKQRALEVGALVLHLTGDTSRTDLVDATQRLSRETFVRVTDPRTEAWEYENVGGGVFQEPKGEALLLYAAMNVKTSVLIDDEHLGAYKNASDPVKTALKEALVLYKEKASAADAPHKTGGKVNAAKVGVVGKKLASTL